MPTDPPTVSVSEAAAATGFSRQTTISVPWPEAGHLSETMWRDRMEGLAERAEQLIGRSDVTLQDRATLAVQWLGLAWSGFSPATVAASCRASLLVCDNVIVAATPADQIVAGLDLVWQQAQADPAAAVIAVPMPLLERGPVPDHVPGTRQRKPNPKPEPVADLPEHDPLAPADLSELTDEQFMSLAPQGLHGPEAPDPIALGESLEPAPAPASVEPELAAPEAPEAPVEPAPAPPVVDAAGWLSVPEVGELLGIATTSVGRWRTGGRLGAEGIDWVADGRTFRFNPDVVEALLDRIDSERDASPPHARRGGDRVADQCPPGWLRPAEVAKLAQCSASKIRKHLQAGDVPAEMLKRSGFRSQWIDPAAVALLA